MVSRMVNDLEWKASMARVGDGASDDSVPEVTTHHPPRWASGGSGWHRSSGCPWPPAAAPTSSSSSDWEPMGVPDSITASCLENRASGNTNKLCCSVLRPGQLWMHDAVHISMESIIRFCVVSGQQETVQKFTSRSVLQCSLLTNWHSTSIQFCCALLRFSSLAYFWMTLIFTDIGSHSWVDLLVALDTGGLTRILKIHRLQKGEASSTNDGA